MGEVLSFRRDQLSIVSPHAYRQAHGPIALSARSRTDRSPGGLSAADLGMLLVCLIWGVNFSVTKLAIAQMPALPFTAIRFTLASVLLVARAARVSRGRPACRARPLRRLVVLGVIGNTSISSPSCSGWPTPRPPTARSSSRPCRPWSRCSRGCWGSSRSPGACGSASALGTIGVVLVIAASGVEFSSATLRGDLLTVLGVLCWAGYTVGLRELPADISPLRVTMMTTIAGTPRTRSRRPAGDGPADLGRRAGDGVGRLGLRDAVSLLVVAYILWNRSVQTVGGTRTRHLHVRDAPGGRRWPPGSCWASTRSRSRESARCSSSRGCC